MKSLQLSTALLFVLLTALFTPSCLEEPDVDTDDCNCLNGGTCIGYTCACPPDYIGVNCETYIGGGGGSSCDIENQALSKNQLLTKLQGFTFDGTPASNIPEAKKMLQFICPAISIHAGDGGYTCGKLANGSHITIWINTYGKTDTYGIRYNQSNGHNHFGSNDTYFEISKNTGGGGGGGTCNSTPYYGTQICLGDYVTVSSSLCCPSAYPYHGVQTNKCYTTCEAAKSDGNTTITFGTGQTGGGGGGGGACNSTPYYGPQNCSNAGYVAVSATACCSASSPYYGAQTNLCYSSCEAAKNAGNTTISYGTGQTGGGGGGGNNCDWNSALNCVSIIEDPGGACGDPESLELTLKNVCNQNIKVYVCFQHPDGSWPILGWSDGTFSSGLAPGKEFQVWTCKGSNYRVFAMPLSMFLDNNCTYPSCQ